MYIGHPEHRNNSDSVVTLAFSSNTPFFELYVSHISCPQVTKALWRIHTAKTRTTDVWEQKPSLRWIDHERRPTRNVVIQSSTSSSANINKNVAFPNTSTKKIELSFRLQNVFASSMSEAEQKFTLLSSFSWPCWLERSAHTIQRTNSVPLTNTG